jgi:Ran GTPase-activating protein (RanGAP) involved in mRNA processing and transport
VCCTAGNGEIGDEGAIRIAEGLEKNTSLKKLDLRDCEIGVRGAKRIGEMLEKNASLVEINLYGEFLLNIPHSSGVI